MPSWADGEGATGPGPGLTTGSAGRDDAGDAAYRAFVEGVEPLFIAAESAEQARVAGAPGAPVVSVIVEVRSSDRELLRRCLASVVAQTYPRWQLCISDDGSAGDALSALEADDRAITTSDGSGSAGAAALATGELVAFLGQHDELAPTALAAVVSAFAADEEIDVVYTDEDLVDPGGGRSRPRFKPGWSPDLLLGCDYVGRLLVARRSLVQGAGGAPTHSGPAADHDLVLRLAERARGVGHVPVVAYHRRQVALPAGPEVVRAALDRRGEDAVVEPGLVDGTHRVRRRIARPPLVSVVVPFRDGADLLRRCVASLHRTAGYERWEAVLVDNASWEPETRALVQRLATDERCRIVSDERPFNWSAINNGAVRHSAGDLLLFLNSDVEGRRHGWLEAMVEHAQRPEVGAVGARLVYPDGRVQHAGVTLGLGGFVAWHPFLGLPPDDPGYLGLAVSTRNVSAVTGACLLVRREVFDEVGGFDEDLAVCFNDVDFCLRLRRRGYEIVYTPFAELVHHESVGRGAGVDPGEVLEMFRRWEPLIRSDPYLNCNLDPLAPQPAVRTGTATDDPWAGTRRLAEALAMVPVP